ncbi:adenylyltransferase [Ochrobactrum sp. 695/2009]|nr:adenylyltransferase [Ochrobactrum sp. 721/2009]PJT17023.1 adenylyltransferase [Ochrobactrum sp. 720/2009]PJT26729.1 adenylyltransferase [Ochrobactrum sp. 715/2009]PJT29977.1 adenylyltransferase [Ochrobactrum sp. 695/2009]PJT36297.1 adenylyltransferase [Ochrobactrum sp. 689/2009]
MNSCNLAIPEEAAKALIVLQECLGSSLQAVYLHGSAVNGGLRPNSDVDLLAVCDRNPAPETSALLVDRLMQISGRHPVAPGMPRCLEVMLFLRQDLAASRYPARCAFIYGEWLRDEFEAGIVPQAHTDPEYTLVLAQAGQEAISLVGPTREHLLPSVPHEYVRRAIADALPALIGNLAGDERNVLLTLARMWYTLETGTFAPKDAAAEWALPLVSPETAAALALAQAAYRGGAVDDWQSHSLLAPQAAEELAHQVRLHL